MTTVVLDTNIFISAFEFGGVPRRVFLLAASGAFELASSECLLDELERVLLTGFEYPSAMASSIRVRVERLCRLVDPVERIVECSDPDDDRVLECAVAAKAKYIVSGDRALLRLSPFRGMQIVTAAQYLAVMSRAEQ